MKNRRLGKFTVSGLFLRGARTGEGVNLFRNMIVLDVQHSFMADHAEYLAWHPAFEPVAEGQMVPEYEAHFDAKSATPIWKPLCTTQRSADSQTINAVYPRRLILRPIE